MSDEPFIKLNWQQHQINLLGTAHVSKASAEKVHQLINQGDYDWITIELCPNRYQSLTDPDSLANMDLFKVIKEGKTNMVMASLALGAYQQRMAEDFGIEPGAEMRTAIEQAKHHHKELLLIDRDIGTTLKRIYAQVSWWKKLWLISALIGSFFSREKIPEEEIERLKEGDMLETSFAQFAEQEQQLFIPLIEERDHYMSLQILSAIAEYDQKQTEKPLKILAVVGAGHLKGIEQFIQSTNQQNHSLEQIKQQIITLEQKPPSSAWLGKLPWLIVALILFGFILGFRENAELGQQLIIEWILINGSLSALGAMIALAHPLTIITAFVAAPLTSLNPMIGAGMVTASVEIWLRKLKVGDFSSLRKDSAHIKGWWKNKVAKVLLVFFFSSMGSAIGTYVAGYRIFDYLT